MEIEQLFKLMIKNNASDFHLKVGSPPFFRIDGKLVPLNLPPLSSEQTKNLAFSVMSPSNQKVFEKKKEVDFAYSLSQIGRFRVNIFQQRGSIGIVFRKVLVDHLTTEKLNLPPTINKLADLPRGLVLVTGTAGSGKTTTISAMIGHINRTRRCHIITIEDPIEILHQDEKSIINQRELGIDTDSYIDALKYVVRQDPDVIFIGEIRDCETAEAALKAAELGNLVLSTLHTIDATETTNRIIDLFPTHQQKLIRIMLASALKSIISLRLLPMVDGGRAPAVEVMVTTATIKQFILNPDETYRIKEAIEKGDYYGMQSFDQSLMKLYEKGKIKLEDAMSMAANEHDFRLKVKQAGLI